MPAHRAVESEHSERTGMGGLRCEPAANGLQAALHLESTRPRTMCWVWMTVIMWVGFALRIARLDKESLWGDEAITWLFASSPFGEGLNRMLLDVVHPPLYFLSLHPIMAVSQTEFALRLPSALLAMLSIPVIYRLARRMVSVPGRERFAGLLAAGILAVNPFHVWFAREARSYQLVFLLSALIFYTFDRVLRGQKGWIGFTLTSALAYFTQYVTLFLALVQLAYFLLRFRECHQFLRRWIAAQLLAGIPLVLWLVALVSQETVQVTLGWIPEASPFAILHTLWDFAILNAGGSLWWGVAALPLFAGVLVLGLRTPSQRTLLILWLFLPCLTVLLLSKTRGYHFYVDRYFTISLPAFIVLLSRGLAQVRQRYLSQALVIALLFVSSAASARIHSAVELTKQDWRGAMRLVTDNWQTGDLKVVETPASAIPISYYLCSLQGRQVDPPYPEGSYWQAILNRCGVVPWAYLMPRSDQDPWAAILDQYTPRRVWLITIGSLPIADDWVKAHQGQILGRYEVEGITLLLIDTANGEEQTGGLSKVWKVVQHRSESLDRESSR